MSSRSKRIVKLAKTSSENVKPHSTFSSSSKQETHDPSLVEPSSTLPSSQMSPTTDNPPLNADQPLQTLQNENSNDKYFSSSESEPFEDSEDSYHPSDDQPDESEDVENSSESSNSEEDIRNGSFSVEYVRGAETVSPDIWQHCTDLPRQFPFIGQSGLKVDHLNCAEPVDIYKHFISDEI